MVIAKYQMLDIEKKLILVLDSPGWEISEHGTRIQILMRASWRKVRQVLAEERRI